MVGKLWQPPRLIETLVEDGAYLEQPFQYHLNYNSTSKTATTNLGGLMNSNLKFKTFCWYFFSLLSAAASKIWL